MFLAARPAGDADATSRGLAPSGGAEPSGRGWPPAATILGVPYDRTTSFRRGARDGPAAVRWASHSIESYSPVLGRDLEELALVDAGDLDVALRSPEAMVEAVAAAVAAAQGLPVVLGGDHTVSVGAVRALAARHPDLGVVVLDAHLDLRDAYEGERWSHATTVRRLAETVGWSRLGVLGVRAGTRQEFADAAGLAFAERRLHLPPGAWTRLEGRPLYLSIDIDALDPADAPGTGNPEPAGPRAQDLLDLLRVLAPLHVVGLDMVEVAPAYDPSGQTAVVAATVVREAILTWAWSSQP